MKDFTISSNDNKIKMKHKIKLHERFYQKRERKCMYGYSDPE